jgi:hypothetical protein
MNASQTPRIFTGLAFLTLILAALALAGRAPLIPTAVAAPLQQNDLPEVFFSQAAYSIIEGNTGQTPLTVTVNINRAPAAGEAVTVNYFTVDGSAISNRDYVPAAGQLTFPAGSTVGQTFTVFIRANTTPEPNRTFIIFLTNPVNARVGNPVSATVTIVDDDPPVPTSTPTPTPGGPVYLDRYEPNNDFATAYTTAANAPKLTGITLWPAGDVDFFRFYGKAGSVYRVFTDDLEPGLDTRLTVFDPAGNPIAENDDADVAERRSEATIVAGVSGFYFARVVDRDPTDPTTRTYSFQVLEIEPFTPTPTATRIGAVDDCEPNNTLATACLIGVGEVKSNMNFVPPVGREPDNDFYRLPVKPGVLYTCETFNLSPVADTNMIFLDNHGRDFSPQLGNDDREVGDPSSLLSYLSTYTGYLYILIGPVNVPPYEESLLHTYDLRCTSTAATPTPPPTATLPPAAAPPGGVGVGVPTATPFVFPTFPPTPTPIDLSSLQTPQPPPVVQFQPLPTATLAAGAQQTAVIEVTVYYDSNFSFTPELTEGIADVAVALYDNTTGSLIAFGYTNEAGAVRFDAITSLGAVRVVVPLLNYAQVAVGASAVILVRVAPQPLPIGIP